MQFLKTAILLTFLFFHLTIASKAQIRRELQLRLDSIISAKSPRPFNGVVLIAEDGKTKYSKAFGYSDFLNHKLLTINDKFVILSNSKQLTAVLVLKEVEKGHIGIQSPIKTYLPNLKESWADSVTVHHLLNHTSGIVSTDKPLAYKPGTKFNYSNFNYVLLGEILEKTSGKKLVDQFESLFKECKMKNTFFPIPENIKTVVKSRQYLANRTVKEVKSLALPSEFVPAGGIISTASDLVKWNKKLHQGKLLERGTYEIMTSYNIKAQHNLFGRDEIGYGYGIRINNTKPIIEYGHTGIIPNIGFTSLNLYYPETNTSVIILENQAYDNLDIAYSIEAAIRETIISSLEIEVN